MKRILCLLLTVVMLFSLCACLAGCDTENVRGEITNNEDDSDQNDKSEKKDETTTDSDKTTAEKPSENKELIPKETIPKETKPQFSMGKTTGSTYKNDFLGISCTLPKEWEFYTDEQMKELNNVVGDYLDADVAEQLKNATIIYDMYAMHAAVGASINVNMEKLSVVQIATLNIKNVLEAQIPTIKSTYQNMGYTDIDAKYQKVTVDGKEFDGMKVTANIQGIDFAMVLIMFRRGNYLATVGGGTLEVDKLEDLLGYFTIE